MPPTDSTLYTVNEAKRELCLYGKQELKRCQRWTRRACFVAFLSIIIYVYPFATPSDGDAWSLSKIAFCPLFPPWASFIKLPKGWPTWPYMHGPFDTGALIEISPVLPNSVYGTYGVVKVKIIKQTCCCQSEWSEHVSAIMQRVTAEPSGVESMFNVFECDRKDE